MVTLPVQLPTNMPGRAVEDSSTTWAPASHRGDTDGVPGSRLKPGTALPVVAIRE